MVREQGQPNSLFFAGVVAVVAVVVATVAWPSPGATPTNDTDVSHTARVVAPPELVLVEPEPLPPAPPPRIRTCQVDPGVAENSNVDIAGSVTLHATGEVLWEVDADSPVVPASVLKVVTARAALRVLGPDFRFTTRVVDGNQPGEVWIVGGGDPTLTRTLQGTSTYYTDPARLSDLVNQLVAGFPETPASEALATIGVDDSRYDAFPAWNDTWRQNAATLGFVTPVTAFMVDGGRLSPAVRLGQRTTDPTAQATAAFLRQVGEATGFWQSDVVQGVAPPQTRVLAEVVSPPLTVLVEQMLKDSDNQIAEALIREVALALSVVELDQAAREGLDPTTPHQHLFFADDGSGLSQRNQMTAALATHVIARVVSDPDMAAIIDSLPVPGEPGSLLRRFTEFDEVWPHVSGKTGSLPGVRSLAGVIDESDVLAFSMFVYGPGANDSSRALIDSLVAQFHDCGENLAHWEPSDPGE